MTCGRIDIIFHISHMISSIHYKGETLPKVVSFLLTETSNATVLDMAAAMCSVDHSFPKMSSGSKGNRLA